MLWQDKICNGYCSSLCTKVKLQMCNGKVIDRVYHCCLSVCLFVGTKYASWPIQAVILVLKYLQTVQNFWKTASLCFFLLDTSLVPRPHPARVSLPRVWHWKRSTLELVLGLGPRLSRYTLQVLKILHFQLASIPIPIDHTQRPRE